MTEGVEPLKVAPLNLRLTDQKPAGPGPGAAMPRGVEFHYIEFKFLLNLSSNICVAAIDGWSGMR